VILQNCGQNDGVSPETAASGADAGDPLGVRLRLLTSTYTCVSRFGLAKTTVEDVVKESGVSRATIYRKIHEYGIVAQPDSQRQRPLR
jgi:hypothetical protein